MILKNERCLIIAEVGNGHEGNLDAALEMLEKAKESGADLVKFQAGDAYGFARNPTDPAEIRKYKKYELGIAGYDKLIVRGAKIGIPVFFSVWGKDFDKYNSLAYRKIPARQCNFGTIQALDSYTTFISIPHVMPLKVVAELPIKFGIPMHVVAQYPAGSGMMTRMHDVRAALKRKVGELGYSDHTIGIYWAVRMATDPYVRARAIEKHFTLAHDYGPLRDHKLAATPSEFKEMVERIKS